MPPRAGRVRPPSRRSRRRPAGSGWPGSKLSIASAAATSPGSLWRASNARGPGPRSSSALRRRRARQASIFARRLRGRGRQASGRPRARVYAGSGTPAAAGGQSSVSTRMRPSLDGAASPSRHGPCGMCVTPAWSSAPGSKASGGRRSFPADLDAGDLRAQTLEDLGQARVGAAVVRRLHGLDVGRRSSGRVRLALGVARRAEVEGAGADDRGDARGFGSSGGGEPGGSGAGAGRGSRARPRGGLAALRRDDRGAPRRRAAASTA